MIWRCAICCVFIALSLKLLLSHINRMHSRSPDIRFVCGIDGCSEDFRVYNSFYHHVKRRHSHHLLEGTEVNEHRPEGSQGQSQQVSMLLSDGLAYIAILVCVGVHFSRFYTHVECELLIKIKDMNEIVVGVQQYQSSLVDYFRTKMEEVLKRHSGTTTPQVSKDAMDIFDTFTDPFTNVATTFRQNSALRMQFGCVDADEIPIGRTLCRKKCGSKEFFIKDKLFYYVPLLKSLQQFLSHPMIWGMIGNGPQICREGFFHDLNDGDLLKSHPLFSENPNALQLILYTDEIEICNPLGSFASKNKLLMVYYTLGNINPKYRSKLASIRLLVIAKSEDIRQSGVDVILKRIKEDLDALYSGVRLQTADGEKKIYGAMVSLCGDTLAQHELAGFKEGVGFAFSKCRHCECSYEDMQSQFREDLFTKRTLEKHIRQCDEIEKANTDLLRSNLKTTYGINRRSELVDFPSFDVIQQTPQDVMHVILEGIAPMEIKCVLNHLIQSGEISLDSVNSGILGFSYSPLDVRDKPSTISLSTLMSNDGKLRQSSGQMLVLLRILPFVLERLEKNAYVQLIIKLIEIVQIVFAPVLSIATVCRLKQLIQDHLSDWKALFPDRSVTPKQHYMLHLPSQIKLLGPMVRHMCMRFESKHCLFKRWAGKINFKNVCKSLVRKNQIHESCQNISTSAHTLFSHEKDLGPMSEVNLHHVRSKLKDFLGFTEVRNAVSVKWLMMNGNKYIIDKSMVFVKVVNGNMPEFGLVRNIFVVDSTLYCLEFQPFYTVRFDAHFMAYEVEVPSLAEATEIVDAEKLVDFTSYYTASTNGKTYVLVKYHLGDVIKLHTT
ncbi:hypothetical protein ACEWY4_028044 [Coilia grayii]|uniref:C2H2-type domain-containing protein n=1 Tax=Coilia grayii TaxID=363190 RepID=A0ABD1IMX1_9TELE